MRPTLRLLTTTPCLPSGRLPPSHLRTLIALHHSSQHFITSSSLPSVVRDVFSGHVTTFADDDTLRRVAARRLAKAGPSGAGEGARLIPFETRGGGPTLDSDIVDNEHLLGHFNASSPESYPTAGYFYSKKNKGDWSSSELSPGAGSRGRGYYNHAARSASNGLGLGLGGGGGSSVRQEREQRLRDAVYGTVGGGKVPLPGLEAVLEDVEVHERA